MGTEFWIGVAIKVIFIPIVMYIARYVVQFLKAKADEQIAKIENEHIQNLLNEATNIIANCVLATTQTYVDNLKEQGKFDIEAQKEAMRLTSEMVITMLPDETKAYLEGSYGELDAIVTNLIEAQIAKDKK